MCGGDGFGELLLPFFFSFWFFTNKRGRRKEGLGHVGEKWGRRERREKKR